MSGGLIWQTLVVSEKKTYFITNSDNEQKTFGIFSKIFRQGCQNCLLRLNRETNRTIIFSGKVLFSYRFLPMSKKFPAFCHEFPEGVVKKDFQNSIGSFWQKILFFFRKKTLLMFADKYWKKFGFCSKNVQHGYQDCSLRVLKTLLREIYLVLWSFNSFKKLPIWSKRC